MSQDRKKKKKSKERKKEEKRREKRRKDKKRQEKRREGTKREEERREREDKKREKKMVSVILFFIPPMVIFLFSVLIVVFFWYRCYRERGQREGEGAGEETGGDGNNNFVAPAGVPKWVTTPRLLLLHYYFSSMYSLVGATARRWFRSSPEDAPVQEIELGVV